MDLQTLISELGEHLGLPNGTAMHETEVCNIELSDGIVLHIEQGEAPEKAHVYSVLGPIPEERDSRERLLLLLLEANLVFRGAENACFAVDSADHQVVLLRSLALENMNLLVFLEALESLTAIARTWRKSMANKEYTKKVDEEERDLLIDKA